MRAALVVLALLVALPARANTLDVYLGSEAVDTDTSTATDTFEFTSLSGTDADWKADSGGNRHRAVNGGDETSKWAYVASGTTASYGEVDLAYWNSTVGSMAIPFHLTTRPSSGCRTIAGFYEGTSTLDCNVQLCSSGGLKLRNGTTDIGASGFDVYTNSCAADIFIGCTSSAQCPASGACSTCSTSTGAGCFWPTQELVQTSTRCELWENGLLVQTSGDVYSHLNISKARIGFLDTGSTATYRTDDIVLRPEMRAGHGYLGWLVPDQNSVGSTCTAPACATSNVMSCLYDWRNGGVYDGLTLNGTARCGTPGDLVRVNTMTTAYRMDTQGLEVEGVQLIVVGEMTEATAYTLGGRIGQQTVDSSCTLNPMQTTVVSNATSDQLLIRMNEALTTGSTPAWEQEDLDTLCLQFDYVAETASGDVGRPGAWGAYVRVRRPDAPPVDNLKDRNNDGLKVLGTLGDSLEASGQQFCVDVHTLQRLQIDGQDVECYGQETACEWTPFKDIPNGGCTSDAQCRTCDGAVSRSSTYNQVGVPCDGGATYACGTGTCSSGICSNNPLAICSTNDDCTLGSCPAAVDAECIDVCPTTGCDPVDDPDCDDVYQCPNRAGWGKFVCEAAEVDVCLSCGVGGETSVGGSIRYPTFRDGDDVNCKAVKGSANCSTTTATSCVVDDDCPGGEFCDFPELDYAVIQETANDRLDHYPEPESYLATFRGFNDSTGNFGQRCTPTYCANDAGCSGISSASKCYGAEDSAPTTTACLDPPGTCASSKCTNTGATCSTDADCKICTAGVPLDPAGSNTCQTAADCSGGRPCVGGIGDSYTNNPVARTGRCGCIAGDCPTGTTCVEGLCRRTCSVDGDCPGALTCVSGKCQGRCTCSCQKDSCSTSADCPEFTWTWNNIVGPARGKCVSSVCRFCGPLWSAASGTTDLKWAFWRNTGAIRPVRTAIDAFAAMQAEAIANESLPTVKRTLNVFITPTRPASSYAFGITAPVDSWGHSGYQFDVRAHLLGDATTFPHVVDAWALQTRDIPMAERGDYYADGIHRKTKGSALLGGDYGGGYLRALNTCAQTATRGQVHAQKYCRSPAGVYKTTGGENGSGDCTNDGHCTLPDRCTEKVCTSDTDCPLSSPNDSCYLE